VKELTEEERTELVKTLNSLIRRIDWVLMNKSPKNEERLLRRIEVLKEILVKLETDS